MLFKKTFAVGAALALRAVQATYQCPISAPKEVTALKYAYAVQDFLYKYYEANGPFSIYDFEDFPSANMMGAGNVTNAEALASNMNGLTQQAMLGVEALTELAKSVNPNAMWSECNYSYPPMLADGGSMAFVQAIYYIEATLCGTFIGLADYVQTPQAAFLMARLSAEHGIHASFLGHYFNPEPYSTSSMALTPAFTPDYVLEPGTSQPVRDNVGHLGAYIPESCAPIPPAPCGASVEIGDLLAFLSYKGNTISTTAAPSGYGMSYGTGMPSPAMSYGTGMPSPAVSYGTGMPSPAMSYGSGTASYSVPAATGAAADSKGYNGIMAGLGGAAAAMAML